MKEKWAYLALVMVGLISWYDGITLVNTTILLIVLVRILVEKDKRLWILTVIISLIVIVQMTNLSTKRELQFSLLGHEEQVTLLVNVNNWRINGDGVSAKAEVIHHRDTFPTVIHYKLKNQSEKQVFEQLSQDMVVSATVEFLEVETNRNIKTFNYANYLKSQKIFVMTKIKNIEASYPQEGIKASIHKIRYQLVDKIKKANDGAITQYTLALLFGERQELSLEELKTFRELGIMHLLAISGLHIIILVEIIEKFFWRIGVLRETTQVIIIIMLILYGFLIQWSISGLRAIMMVILQIISQKYFGKSFSTMDCLSLVLLVNCIWNPYLIYHSACQLSYGMCFFVILIGKLEWPFLKDCHGSTLIKRLLSLLALCLLAIPLVAKYFYSYHLLSAIIGLIMTIILAKWIIPSLLVYVLVILVHAFYLADCIAFLFNNSVLFVLTILEFVSQWSIFKVTLGAGNSVVWCVYYVLVITLLLECQKVHHLRQQIFLITNSICLIIVLAIIPYQFEQKVVYLDVGQGDSSLIIDRGYNNVVLIDTGGQPIFQKESWRMRKSSSHAEKTVIPALQALGISKIKTIFLTHADTDHMGNLLELSQSFPIEQVVIAKGMDTHPKVIKLKQQVPQLVWTVIEAPVTFVQGDIKMNILKPTGLSSGDNRDSLVVDVQFANVDWLFLGDIDQEKELELVKEYPQLRTDILKLAHHGSNTSSHMQFLTLLESDYAIISCGKNNLYHHPSTDVIKRLNDIQLNYARTDKEGAIAIIPKKNKIIVRKILTNDSIIISP